MPSSNSEINPISLSGSDKKRIEVDDTYLDSYNDWEKEHYFTNVICNSDDWVDSYHQVDDPHQNDSDYDEDDCFYDSRNLTKYCKCICHHEDVRDADMFDDWEEEDNYINGLCNYDDFIEREYEKKNLSNKC
jgi:hypothetical protein